MVRDNPMLNPAACAHTAAQYAWICEPSPSRRGFLSSLGALGAAVGLTAALPGCTTAGSGTSVKNRIDTHHHVFSPAYVQELAKVNQAPPIVRNWPIAKTLDVLKAEGVGLLTSYGDKWLGHPSFAPIIDPKLVARVPNGVLHELKRFYYDTSWSAHPGALASLMKLVNVSQVLFGSDYPYRTGEDHVKGIIDYGFSQSDLDAIGRGNAQRLMPQWIS